MRPSFTAVTSSGLGGAMPDLEFRKPEAEIGQFPGRQSQNGFFDVLQSHPRRLALTLPLKEYLPSWWKVHLAEPDSP